MKKEHRQHAIRHRILTELREQVAAMQPAEDESATDHRAVVRRLLLSTLASQPLEILSHGASGYAKGCRCPTCSEWNDARLARFNERHPHRHRRRGL